MTDNMNCLFTMLKPLIEKNYPKELPTEDQITDIAMTICKNLAGLYPITDEEFNNLNKRLRENILHTIGIPDTLTYRDNDHEIGWYKRQENDNYFWNRYRCYLSKKWSREIINRLDQTTTEILDNCGDPKSPKMFQRRGLLLGDVQSGKTATYTGICNKAADVGYKIIIVLTGMTENLRRQTQERLDMEFVGFDSKG